MEGAAAGPRQEQGDGQARPADADAEEKGDDAGYDQKDLDGLDGGDTGDEDEQDENDAEEDLVGEGDNIEQGIDAALLRLATMHGRLVVLIEKARGLVKPSVGCAGTCGVGFNPVATLMIGHDPVLRTSVVRRSRNPDWKELFAVDVCHEAQRLTIRVADANSFEDTFLGQVSFSVAQIVNQAQGSSGVQGEFPIARRRRHVENLDTFAGAWTEDRKEKRKRRKTSSFGWLSFRLQFTPAKLIVERQLQVFQTKSRAVKSKGKSRLVERFHPKVVPNTYFRAHRGDHFVLYQSAHQPALGAQLPEIALGVPDVDALGDSASAGGGIEPEERPFRARGCWADLYHAIDEAEQFICVSGSAINPHTRRVRTGPAHERKLSFGQLLKDKAAAGVLVFVLAWEDPKANPFFAEAPVNGTSDLLENFFRGSKVVFATAARENESGHDRSLTEGVVAYTHHQRAIVMDIKPSNAAKLRIKHRKHKNAKVQAVTAFLGGMDIATGRYDDADKTLFASLERTHSDDFYQPYLPDGVAKRTQGPRMPWQDVHARVTGSSAVDVLKNFIERWHKQVAWHRYRLLRGAARLDTTYLAYAGKMKALLNLLKDSPGEAALPQSFLDEARDQIKGRAETVLRLGDNDGNVRNNFGINHQNLEHEDDDDDDLSDMSDEDLQDLQQDLEDLVAEERERSGSWNAAFSTDSRQNTEKVVQVLRSIDEDAAELDRRVTAPQVFFQSDMKVDNSVHKAFVHHVRHARHFLYIETEYFVGSAHMWERSKGCGANNLVPGEIAEKICAKIAAKEPFHVYLVLPLHPRGVPRAVPVQQVLFWQHLTVQMMYQRIARALRAAGLADERHPTDYFTISFLGNREPAEEHKRVTENELDLDAAFASGDEGAIAAALAADPDGAAAHAAEKSAAASAAAAAGLPTDEDYAAVYRRMLHARRAPIHVNSKLMIVDDEVAIIGSGNINQRSLAGTRDTELGVAVFEADKMSTADSTPRGQVYGLRMSLWAEHLGPENVDNEGFDATLLQTPARIETVRLWQSLALANWETYTSAKDPDGVPGHLMRYPYHIAPDGTVSALAGFESFPDFTKAPVLGSRSSIANYITT